MNLKSKKDIVFLTLAGFFVCNAIIAEMIGGKLINFFGIFTQSVGIILWPVVFVITDLVNEYYGKDGVKKLSLITVGLISYTFIILFICINLTATNFSPVSDENFHKVFGQSMYIIVGSIAAFLISQLVDSSVFWILRNRTGHKMLWLRSTGSTVISQLVDTFVVQFVGFVVPGKWTMGEFTINASWGYFFKLLVALAMIPLIYLGHYWIDRYIGEKLSHDTIKHSAEASLEHKVDD
jgi:uncharacterized integral membrane protein (TIGR00697 family)